MTVHSENSAKNRRRACITRTARRAFALFRRFQRVDLHLDSAVLRLIERIGGIGGHVPAEALRTELFGIERVEFVHQRFLHSVRALIGKFLYEVRGNLALHAAVGVAFDDDTRRAELPGKFADFFGVAIEDLFPAREQERTA